MRKGVKDLAKDLNIEPNMVWLLFTDFELFLNIYTGSCHPMVYRIHGYKSYNNSRQVLLNTFINIHKRKLFEWKYLLLHFTFHLIFIAFLTLIAFLLSYFVYISKKFQKIVKYKQYIFIGLSISLILIFYIFF